MNVWLALLCLLALAACQPTEPTATPGPGTLPAPVVTAPAHVDARAGTKPVVTTETVPKEIPREVLKYRNLLIREIRVVWGDGEPADTFFGQIHAESRWQTDAQSKYASGLAQFVPDTARWMNGLYPVELASICEGAGGCPTDPRWAIRAMIRYDDRLYRAIVDAAVKVERIAYMLASYNSGPGWVARERAISSDRSRWFDATEHVCLRRTDFCEETKNYVHNIIGRFAPLYRSWLAR